LWGEFINCRSVPPFLVGMSGKQRRKHSSDSAYSLLRHASNHCRRHEAAWTAVVSSYFCSKSSKKLLPNSNASQCPVCEGCRRQHSRNHCLGSQPFCHAFFPPAYPARF